MNANQEIFHGRGRSNINLPIFVCYFDVCLALKPFPVINYDVTTIDKNYKQSSDLKKKKCFQSFFKMSKHDLALINYSNKHQDFSEFITFSCLDSG